MQKAIADLIEKELRLTYLQAVNSSEILINAFDQKRRIVLWNKKAENYFGVNREFAIGNKLEEILPYVAGNEKMAYLDEALNGKPVIIEKEKYMKRTAFYRQRILPVEKDGKIVAALNIVWDWKEEGPKAPRE